MTMAGGKQRKNVPGKVSIHCPLWLLKKQLACRSAAQVLHALATEHWLSKPFSDSLQTRMPSGCRGMTLFRIH